MSKTIFYAKKILSRREYSWEFNITLQFEGREFSLTDIPIILDDEEEVQTLCPGADLSSGDEFSDTIAIKNVDDFESVFRSVLTDEATELLADVYSGRSWKMKLLDTSGKEYITSAYITEEFIKHAKEMINNTELFWMEIKSGKTRFNEDWSIDVEDESILFSNMQDGLEPINSAHAYQIIDSLTPIRMFNDREEFKGTVMKSGNSLVIKVTDQCRRMGIGTGDEVSVRMDLKTASDNTMLRVFSAQNWEPIVDPDDICHLPNRDLKLVERFLNDFNIIGTVNAGTFKPAILETGIGCIFDHLNFFKDKNGDNMVVSQPYKKSFDFETASEWARKNGCTVEELSEYSWHHPPETTLIVFKMKRRPNWMLPERKETKYV